MTMLLLFCFGPSTRTIYIAATLSVYLSHAPYKMTSKQCYLLTLKKTMCSVLDSTTIVIMLNMHEFFFEDG